MTEEVRTSVLQYFNYAFTGKKFAWLFDQKIKDWAVTKTLARNLYLFKKKTTRMFVSRNLTFQSLQKTKDYLMNSLLVW